MIQRIILLAACIFYLQILSAQSTGDYRSAATGNWSAAASWERFDGTNWAAAPAAPSNTDGIIAIRSGHTITINSATTADQVTVDAGGTLASINVLNALTLTDGTGTDLIVNGILNNGGTIAGAGAILINGTMNWTIGTLSVDITIAAGGTLNNNTNNKTFNGGKILINQGTLNWGAVAWNISESSSFINEATINATGNSGLNGPTAGNLFHNTATGVFTKSVGTGTTQFGLEVNNEGTININSGTVSFIDDVTSSGSINASSKTTLITHSPNFFNDNGGININSATLDNTGDLNINSVISFTGNCNFHSGGNTNFNVAQVLPAEVNFSSTVGAMSGSGSLTVNGPMDWSAGNLSVDLTINSSSTLTVNSSSNKGLSGGKIFTNKGTMSWSGGNFLFQGFTTINEGTITASSHNSLSSTGTNLFHNKSTGIFSKTLDGGTTAFGTPVTNEGIINGTGTLSFTTTFTDNGILAPGLSPGIITINGTNPFGANSSLNIEIKDGSGAGTGHDQLQRAGNLILNGTLAVVETGNVPDGDYTIISLTSGIVSGTFASTNLPANYSVIYNSNNVVVRKGTLNTYYQDADGDGFGNPAVSQQAGSPPQGYVANNTDCDDGNAAINPNTVWYLDTDNDNYYTGSGVTQCVSPGAGYRRSGLTGGGDCNDNSATIHPGATEVCNGTDDDCDGQIDEGVKTTFYQDADADGFGNASITQQACSAPNGYVANNTDCNDNSATIHPGATEVCNGIDDDCDGQIDEGMKTTFYQDADADGFGNPAVTQQACSAPQGYVTNNTDCNDGDVAINPNSIWYLDADNDNYYVGSGVTQCSSPGTGYRMSGLTGGSDCNDNNANTHPGATEICNNNDDDCDGQIDEDAQPVNWYRDADADGYGDASVLQSSCTQPNGYVLNNTDCNDNNINVHPGATELCNGVDDDCDGLMDEGVKTTFFRDLDGDGFGDLNNTTQACSVPEGFVANSTDCNDNNVNFHPGATEVCNGLDDDCDGQIDEGVITTFYRDNDGDGFGNAAVTQQACSAPNGYVANNTDCNDNNTAINPNSIWYLDADNDNYYTGSGITRCSSPGAGYKMLGLTAGGDCNDNNTNIHPGATEICNNIDDDCDGQTDEGAQSVNWYRDLDSDGYGNASISQSSCTQPNGYVLNNTDCNDNNIDIHPGATEVCNGIDDDCNGQTDEGVTTTFYRDNDGDGFGNTAVTQQTCSAPNGYVANNTDCNDGNVNIHPGATEICNGEDDDCDGQIDEGCAGNDNDGDGYTSVQGDCNDNEAAIHPEAIEICGNGVDENCNDQIDENCNTELPVMVIRTYPFKEGDVGQTIFDVEIKLDRPATLPVHVNFATSNDDAVAGLDYAAINGMLVIPAGSASGVIHVRIIGDLLRENNERFWVNFSNPVNVRLEDDSRSRIMIIDDDKGKNNNTAVTRAKGTELQETNSMIPNIVRRNHLWMIPMLMDKENDIEVMNMQGQIIFRASNYRNNIPMANVTSGLYFYCIKMRDKEGKLKYYRGKLFITE